MKKKKVVSNKIFRLLGVIVIGTVSTVGFGVQTYKLHNQKERVAILEQNISETKGMFSELSNVYGKHDDGSFSLTTDVVRVRLWTNSEGQYELKVTENDGSLREINNKAVLVSLSK